MKKKTLCCIELESALDDNWIRKITGDKIVDGWYRKRENGGKLGLYDREYDEWFEPNIEYCPFCGIKIVYDK